ncbi:hypothetical protein P692DRAFT_201935487 [Suillus brevipes Sb2]|nr:hypothetical protein P692DRAFT_201935487 [Suillus brevipes Sb2]
MKEGNKLAEEIKLAFMQVSLQNGRNVEEVFVHIARLIKNYQERKKRISSIHWAYYDQKILDDRYDKVQGRKRAHPHKIRQSLIPIRAPTQTAPPKATQTLNGATTSSKTQKNLAYHHQDSPSTPLSLANLIRAARWPAQSLRIMISSSTPAKQYDSWSMYDLSSSPSTTVSSTLKTLNSRFEHPTNSRNDEEIPASWSGMWGTWSVPAAMTKANGRAARGVHGRSFSASPASATPSWALQHSLSMSTSINKKNTSTPDGSPSPSRPPSPGLSLLNEALSDSILPTVPPRARLPPCFSPARLLSRPPPLLSNLLSTLPSASVFSIPPYIQNGLPLSSADPAAHIDEPCISLNHSLPIHSSINTLRSIHASTAPQIAPFPISSKWWFQSDSDSGSKDNVDKLLNEEDQASSLNKIHQKYRSPSAPVVFCHGLLGFDTVTVGPSLAPLQVAHWRGIKEALEANGCEVLNTRIPATSSPVERAKVLEKKILEVYPGRAVHLIGHSMGGLDCRYLTTHLTQRKFSHLPSVLVLLELLSNGGGDGKAFECLTLESMRQFNEETPDVEGVRYFSWGACYEPGLIDTWKWPHSIILEKEGPNDGVVSVESAKWVRHISRTSTCISALESNTVSPVSAPDDRRFLILPPSMISNSCNSIHSPIPTTTSISISAPKRQVKTGSLIVLNQLIVSAPLQTARLMSDIVPILAEVIWDTKADVKKAAQQIGSNQSVESRLDDKG